MDLEDRYHMNFLANGKRVFNKALAHWGHAVAHEGVVPSFDRLVGLLEKVELRPKTVVDVGVAYGTPWLYSAFPSAKFHLVDPTRESLPHMERWAGILDADVHNVALGKERGQLTIATRNTIEHATLLRDVTSPTLDGRYDVRVDTFDSLFPHLERPSLCKIDVEGAEMMVLQGMERSLAALDCIIVETTLNSLYDEGVDFGALVSFFRQKHFSLFDFVGMTRRPYDGALHQVDAVFVPDGSPLRIKRWS